jgi:DNA topoisomerase-1
MRRLMIMESTTKCKTIQNYLGDEYLVLSCDGHIRDLSSSGKYGLGIDLDTMEPIYNLIKSKIKKINLLKKHVKNAEEILLATDKDREGEAIAFHLREVLQIPKELKRVTFNEITISAIKSAIENAHSIDESLVRSQQARQMLDKMIGFRLSKLLQRKIKTRSAGRVQSVALKLIVDRNKEIENFTPEEY